MTDPKDELQTYLQRARDALLWKLDGLSEYDVRRPLVPTGTNLLGTTVIQQRVTDVLNLRNLARQATRKAAVRSAGLADW